MCKLRYIIAAVAVLAFSSPPAAQAITLDSTFTFAGTCSDCGTDNGAGTATGTLVLQNYTLGNVLQSSNFVSFTYTSIVLGTLTVDSSEFQHFSVTSELADLPDFEDVAINWIDGGGNEYQFQSGTDGTWSVEDEGSTSARNAAALCWRPRLRRLSHGPQEAQDWRSARRLTFGTSAAYA